MLNGDGLRVTSCGWPAGQCLRPGCHNPITWDAKADCCLIRQQRLSCSPSLARTIISGITFSGDPALGKLREEISELCQRDSKFDKTIWPGIPATAEEIAAAVS